jgi:zinc transport system substrate-binding protein
VSSPEVKEFVMTIALAEIRMRNYCLTVVLPVCFIILAALCQARAQEPIQVTVTIPPQKYFVEKIGGSLVAISVMVPSGANMHNYEPKPQQMVALAKSKIYFAVGDPIERAWLRKIVSANTHIHIVHTEEGVEKIPMASHHHEEHGGQNLTLEHGHSSVGKEWPQGPGEEASGVLDPHIWLAPHLVMIQARNIFTALCRVDPAHQDQYESNYKSFITELVALDLEIRKVFAEKGGIRFMVFHPAWGYFARAYGLEQIPIEIEGKEPKPADIRRLIQEAKNLGVKVIFVQPQLSAKAAETIASAIGGQITSADPLASDWADNLRRVARSFKSALR